MISKPSIALPFAQRDSNAWLQRFLLIDTTEHGCRVQEYKKTTRSFFELTTQFDLSWEMPHSAQDTQNPVQQQRGQELRAELDKRRITTQSVVFNCPRNSVLLKRFPIAEVEPQYLSDAVLLEAEARGINPEEFRVDYVRYPREHALAGQVCIAAMPQTTIQSLQELTRHAGLKLEHLQLQSLNHSLCHAIGKAQNTALHLHIEKDKTHLVMLLEGLPFEVLLLPHPTANEQELWQFLTARVKLLLHAWREPLAENVPPLWFSGVAANRGMNYFRSQTDFEKHSVHLLQCSGVEPALGVAVPATRTFNFAFPKRSPSARAEFWRKSRRAALTWILAGSLLMLLGKLYLDHVDRRCQQLSARLAALQRESLQDEELLARARELDDWLQRAQPVSAEVVKLVEQLPSNEQIFLKSLRFERTSDDLPAEIQIEGSARTLEQALELNRKLIGDGSHYELRPGQFDRKNNIPHYPVGFSISGAVKEAVPSTESRAVTSKNP